MGNSPVKLTPEAQTELLEASAFYEDSAGLGDAFLDCVAEGLVRIGEAPEAHGPAPGFEELGIRLALIRRFPYHLPFLVLPDRISVIAVAHVRRRPGFWGTRLRKH